VPPARVRGRALAVRSRANAGDAGIARAPEVWHRACSETTETMATIDIAARGSRRSLGPEVLIAVLALALVLVV